MRSFTHRPIVLHCRSVEDINNLLACGVPADLRTAHRAEISLRDYLLFAKTHPCDFGDTSMDFEDPTLRRHLRIKRQELRGKPKMEFGHEPLRFDKTRNILVLGEKGSKKDYVYQEHFHLEK